jgi:mannosyl-oligosaccharide alpha-1,2-mannosidase
MNAFEQSQNTTRLPGMWPVQINAHNLDFANDRTFTLGAMADSLYEYFPKVCLLVLFPRITLTDDHSNIFS